MKTSICLAVLLGFFGAVGCGSSDDGNKKDLGPSDLASFVSPGPTLDLSRVCISSCTQDSQCQNTCPAVTTTGVNCCDVQTNVCFVSTTTTCPVPVVPDMAQSQSMY